MRGRLAVVLAVLLMAAAAMSACAQLNRGDGSPTKDAEAASAGAVGADGSDSSDAASGAESGATDRDGGSGSDETTATGGAGTDASAAGNGSGTASEASSASGSTGEGASAGSGAGATTADPSAVVPVPGPAALESGLTRDTYPRVDGSTVTIPLSEQAASHILGLSALDVRSFIMHNRTDAAYRNLCDGLADIIFVTAPSPDELAYAKEKNLTLEVVPVVKDAFVFLVNDSNPVRSLTRRQIRDIYQGKIANWKDVGGTDGQILAYQRPQNSGSQTLMENFVMKGLTMMSAPSEMKPAEMSGLIEVVSAYDNSERAIGYTFYYYANDMYMKDNIRFLGVDGIVPSDDAIRTDEYPFGTAYYAVLDKASPADSPARRLLKWLLSDEGQQVASDNGYVPVR